MSKDKFGNPNIILFPNGDTVAVILHRDDARGTHGDIDPRNLFGRE